ncbi:MAG TPA: MBL fold metallo-hydrolase [Gemmataceae bacterium]|jgi:ribonuclease Z|nr:MBL fold metallo-hydrolase [Gemmataceae bacterium]
MNLTLLGTGCPQVDTERYGPASLVCHDGFAFLVDCGSGATQRLLAAGWSGRALDALFLTHLHSDHIVDLFQLIISSWHQGRDRPQCIFGPPGTRRFCDGLLALWRAELDQRIAHELRSSTQALELEVIEYQAGLVLAKQGVRVTAVEVDHRPVQFAYGFIFEAGGRKLVFSGDTAYCPALIEAARGADVLVHECFLHDVMAAGTGNRTAAGLRNIAGYHTLSSEVGKLATAAGVRCLVLNHFVPVDFDKSALLAEVRRDYAGPIVLGEDLLNLDMDTGQISYAGLVLGLAP